MLKTVYSGIQSVYMLNAGPVEKVLSSLLSVAVNNLEYHII